MAAFKVRTLAVIGREHSPTMQRRDELRQALEAAGARDVEIEGEISCVLDAVDGKDAMRRVDEILLTLSWPTSVSATPAV